MARPMTMAEKILADHAGLEEVVPGQLVECDLDLVLANDITAPIAIKTVREIDKVKDSYTDVIEHNAARLVRASLTATASAWSPTTTAPTRTSRAPNRPR